MCTATKPSVLSLSPSELLNMLPVELMREIAQYICLNPYEELGKVGKQVPGSTSKPSWGAVDAFTRTCRNYRSLGLEVWFNKLFLTREVDTQELDIYFPEAKEKWCRRIHCVQREYKGSSNFTVWDLTGFQRIQSIRVDWMTQKAYPYFYESHGTVHVPFANVECQVDELYIIGRHISPAALGGFIEPFPHLRVLKLDLQGTWCSLCNTSNTVKLPYMRDRHFTYNNGLGLSMHYGRVLCRLSALEEVHILANNRGSIMPISGISEEKDDTMWSGECSDCMELLYDDNAFLRQWVDRKNGNVPTGTKFTAYNRPARLRKVHWHLLRRDSEPADDDSSEWSSSEEGEFMSILSSPAS